MFFRLFTGMAQSYKFSWKKNFFEFTSYPVSIYDHHLSEGYFEAFFGMKISNFGSDLCIF